MRHWRILIGLAALSMVLAACGGGPTSPPPPPPQIELHDVTFEWDEQGIASWMRGRVVNVGGSAQYIEIGVKITPPDDPDHILASGMANFLNFGSGESRPINLLLLPADEPAGPWTYHWRWSTEVGKATY